MPVFRPPAGTTRGLDKLATAAMAQSKKPLMEAPKPPATSLSTPGPYKQAAGIQPKVVKKILDLEFIEMTELNIPSTNSAGQQNHRGCSRLPVTEIKLWLECFARMAAILTMCFPEKGPEFWTYKTTILRDEGSKWVGYDCQFRQDRQAEKDLVGSKQLLV